eukprot:TRINITY_DN3958_c0_g2_i2.p1 TRINITY_DN3958_c0_g2~~TRINITY_DN3958_c0_g2_i2.p1  ORF type:complete len:2170 (-),score=552.81 TRINITY_DN3958_c0_g2_i2:70-6453(-)
MVDLEFFIHQYTKKFEDQANVIDIGNGNTTTWNEDKIHHHVQSHVDQVLAAMKDLIRCSKKEKEYIMLKFIENIYNWYSQRLKEPEKLREEQKVIPQFIFFSSLRRLFEEPVDTSISSKPIVTTVEDATLKYVFSLIETDDEKVKKSKNKENSPVIDQIISSLKPYIFREVSLFINVLTKYRFKSVTAWVIQRINGLFTKKDADTESFSRIFRAAHKIILPLGTEEGVKEAAFFLSEVRSLYETIKRTLKNKGKRNEVEAIFCDFWFNIFGNLFKKQINTTPINEETPRLPDQGPFVEEVKRLQMLTGAFDKKNQSLINLIIQLILHRDDKVDKELLVSLVTEVSKMDRTVTTSTAMRFVFLFNLRYSLLESQNKIVVDWLFDGAKKLANTKLKSVGFEYLEVYLDLLDDLTSHPNLPYFLNFVEAIHEQCGNSALVATNKSVEERDLIPGSEMLKKIIQCSKIMMVHFEADSQERLSGVLSLYIMHANEGIRTSAEFVLHMLFHRYHFLRPSILLGLRKHLVEKSLDDDHSIILLLEMRDLLRIWNEDNTPPTAKVVESERSRKREVVIANPPVVSSLIEVRLEEKANVLESMALIQLCSAVGKIRKLGLEILTLIRDVEARAQNSRVGQTMAKNMSLSRLVRVKDVFDAKAADVIFQLRHYRSRLYGCNTAPSPNATLVSLIEGSNDKDQMAWTYCFALLLVHTHVRCEEAVGFARGLINSRVNELAPSEHDAKRATVESTPPNIVSWRNNLIFIAATAPEGAADVVNMVLPWIKTDSGVRASASSVLALISKNLFVTMMNTPDVKKPKKRWVDILYVHSFIAERIEKKHLREDDRIKSQMLAFTRQTLEHLTKVLKKDKEIKNPQKTLNLLFNYCVLTESLAKYLLAADREQIPKETRRNLFDFFSKLAADKDSLDRWVTDKEQLSQLIESVYRTIAYLVRGPIWEEILTKESGPVISWINKIVTSEAKQVVNKNKTRLNEVYLAIAEVACRNLLKGNTEHSSLVETFINLCYHTDSTLSGIYFVSLVSIAVWCKARKGQDLFTSVSDMVSLALFKLVDENPRVKQASIRLLELLSCIDYRYKQFYLQSIDADVPEVHKTYQYNLSRTLANGELHKRSWKIFSQAMTRVRSPQSSLSIQMQILDFLPPWISVMKFPTKTTEANELLLNLYELTQHYNASGPVPQPMVKIWAKVGSKKANLRYTVNYLLNTVLALKEESTPKTTAAGFKKNVINISALSASQLNSDSLGRESSTNILNSISETEAERKSSVEEKIKARIESETMIKRIITYMIQNNPVARLHLIQILCHLLTPETFSKSKERSLLSVRVLASLVFIVKQDLLTYYYSYLPVILHTCILTISESLSSFTLLTNLVFSPENISSDSNIFHKRDTPSNTLRNHSSSSSTSKSTTNNTSNSNNTNSSSTTNNNNSSSSLPSSPTAAGAAGNKNQGRTKLNFLDRSEGTSDSALGSGFSIENSLTSPTSPFNTTNETGPFAVNLVKDLVEALSIQSKERRLELVTAWADESLGWITEGLQMDNLQVEVVKSFKIYRDLLPDITIHDLNRILISIYSKFSPYFQPESTEPSSTSSPNNAPNSNLPSSTTTTPSLMFRDGSIGNFYNSDGSINTFNPNYNSDSLSEQDLAGVYITASNSNTFPHNILLKTFLSATTSTELFFEEVMREFILSMSELIKKMSQECLVKLYWTAIALSFNESEHDFLLVLRLWENLLNHLLETYNKSEDIAEFLSLVDKPVPISSVSGTSGFVVSIEDPFFAIEPVSIASRGLKSRITERQTIRTLSHFGILYSSLPKLSKRKALPLLLSLWPWLHHHFLLLNYFSGSFPSISSPMTASVGSTSPLAFGTSAALPDLMESKEECVLVNKMLVALFKPDFQPLSNVLEKYLRTTFTSPESALNEIAKIVAKIFLPKYSPYLFSTLFHSILSFSTSNSNYTFETRQILASFLPFTSNLSLEPSEDENKEEWRQAVMKELSRKDSGEQEVLELKEKIEISLGKKSSGGGKWSWENEMENWVYEWAGFKGKGAKGAKGVLRGVRRVVGVKMGKGEGRGGVGGGGVTPSVMVVMKEREREEEKEVKEMEVIEEGIESEEEEEREEEIFNVSDLSDNEED